MNYIEQINFFWTKHREHSLSDTDIATYFNILKHSNSSNWKNPVLIRNGTFLDELKLKDLRTLQNSRNKLQQLGLISFTQRERDPICTYKLVSPAALNAARHAPRDAARHAAADAPEDAPPILIDKPKPKPKRDKPEAKPPALHQKLMKVYFDWFEKTNDFTPKIDGQQGKALKSIIGYLSDLARRKFQKDEVTATETEIEDYVQQVWNWLFENWHKLDAFNQKLTQLSQINSNLQNLITQIKKENGRQQEHKTPQRGIGEDAITDFVNRGNSG